MQLRFFYILLGLSLLFSCQDRLSLNIVENIKPTRVSFFSPPKINSIQTIIQDMDSCGEAIPHGVLKSFNWRECPRLSYGNDPQHLNAVLPWGQFYETKSGSHATNTRVQIRNLYVYYLSKSTDTWVLWTGSSDVQGAYYVEDFINDVHIPSVDVREEPSGGISAKPIPDYNYHFWSTDGRVMIDANDIDGVWAYCEARLIVDDSTKNDDREKASYILSTGADYWLNLTASWDASWHNNGDIGIGRFKYVTKEWRAFNMHTLSKKEILSNPPPFK